MKQKSCSKCGITKLLVKTGKKSVRKYIYKDDSERNWHGLVCPDCTNKRYHKPILNKQCKECNKDFVTSHPTYAYCSSECRLIYNKTIYIPVDRIQEKQCKLCSKQFTIEVSRQGRTSEYCSNNCRNRSNKGKGIPILKKLDCSVCKSSFETNLSKKLYCNKKCKKKAHNKRKPKSDTPRQLSKQSKDKRKLRKRALSKRFKSRMVALSNNKALIQKYSECPSGMEVDHIIPLNGENVSGLHVDWNLDFLSPEDNGKKLAQFDGTYDNKTWRDISEET